MDAQIIAGDTLDFLVTEASSAYPATEGWTLTYRLVPRTSTDDAIEFDAVAEGSDYRVTVPAATTAGWVAGSYRWSSWVELSGERHSIRTGLVTLLPDPATVEAGYDGRSHARKVVDAINAVIEGRASRGQQETEVQTSAGMRRIKHMTVEELLMLRDRYQAELAREDAADQRRQGRGDTSNTFVSFRRV